MIIFHLLTTLFRPFPPHGWMPDAAVITLLWQGVKHFLLFLLSLDT